MYFKRCKNFILKISVSKISFRKFYSGKFCSGNIILKFSKFLFWKAYSKIYNFKVTLIQIKWSYSKHWWDARRNYIKSFANLRQDQTQKKKKKKTKIYIYIYIYKYIYIYIYIYISSSSSSSHCHALHFTFQATHIYHSWYTFFLVQDQTKTTDKCITIHQRIK